MVVLPPTYLEVFKKILLCLGLNGWKEGPFNGFGFSVL